MSAHLLTPPSVRHERTTPGFGHRIAERRRLARQDRTSALLAELQAARAVLASASAVVAAGWIQDGWFSYRDEQGRERLVSAANLSEITGQRLTGACLVGAIVQGGGGLPAARSGPVHRALDLTWQALFSVTQPVGHCPAPALRSARVRELTRWNDQPSRTAGEATSLLAAAERVAADQVERVLLLRGAA